MTTAANLSRLQAHPIGFLWRYVRRHPWGHFAVFVSVLVAVACAVSIQYGIKHLVDVVSAGPEKAVGLWQAFAILCGLIAADNLLWRGAGWSAAYTFVAVTGDIRRDLFGHLSGHSPSYFAERLPGALASRITATANAAFTTENTCSWNVLPPCVAVIGSIILIGMVNLMMAATLVAGIGRAGCAGVLPGATRHAAASQLRRQGRRGRWRIGGRDRQHAGGARVRRHAAGAAAHRRPPSASSWTRAAAA